MAYRRIGKSFVDSSPENRMARTAKITLDGTEYTIRAFNIGELERIQEAGASAWIVLRIALERAEPKVSDPNAIEPLPEELQAAFETIMKLAGMKPADPTQAAPAAA